MAVIDLLRQAVEDRPDKTAVIAEDGAATFRELDAASSRLAQQLHAAGVSRGHKVAMLLANDQAMHFNAVYFGIHKLGAVPVPLNTRWAAPEKLFVLEHSDAVAVITGLAHREVLVALAEGESVEIGGRPGSFQLEHFFVTGSEALDGFTPLGDVVGAGSADVPLLEPSLSADDPADLLYTSGTTGMPRGVLVPEGNLADEPGQASLGQLLGAMFGESLLHAVPLFGFTGCHGLMLLSIRAGVTQIVLPRFDPEQLLAAIERYRATSIMGVPTMLNLAMKHPTVGDHDYSSLQLVFFGAAPIQPDTVRKMRQVWPGAKMLNAYSLTEAGAGAACILGPDPDDILARPGSVGRPVGCEVVVVDDYDNPLPPGKVGEICFKSKIARRSYYKGEQPTAELWSGGLLHTGDVGYVADDGYVYLTERKKDMILRGGYNIFAIEVERVLLEMPEVLEAAVIAVPHSDLGEDLLAVIAPKPGFSGGEGELTAERINQFCRQHLADYKCPRHMVVVDELPKNAMAKVMKNELRQRFRDHLFDQGAENK
ncbi:class I adenylate-forming enzyme family protein [Mycobacterium avium]|uniref:Long-chain-fatty-acid--CoA ligase FadD13 n=1 Tax=Mycobacterium avium subsp. hominissuis TaxID=439334 RepID=A0AAI8X1D3_MYCAV|nr:class I adenylate-forming enzyme family protein [Mycobacterium avium]BBN46533.1 fatty acid--CoA ligase [Mycobacterium avium subsp. hominissuis]